MGGGLDEVLSQRMMSVGYRHKPLCNVKVAATPTVVATHAFLLEGAATSVVIPGREEVDPLVRHLVDQAVFAVDAA